jgi:uroporphyrin-3 C-methyltransferase
MANNNDKQQIDNNVQDAELVNEKKAQFSGNRPLWVALAVVAILVLALAGWFYQKLQAEQAKLAGMTDLQTELNSLNQTIAERDEQLNALQQQHQTLSDTLDEFMARDTLTSADIKKAWALQEIEYLLNVANQRALLAKDVAGAYQALNLAAEQVRQLADYRLHPLRAIITEEMMQLDALADLDQQGIALKLQTAANHVQRLRVKKGPEVNTAMMLDEADVAAADSGWRQAVSDIWQQLRSLVVIRHDDTGEAAVLVPEQRYFLYQNLRLQLESARLALLNADSSSYQHSLKTAINWLEKYFTGAERDAMLNTLRELQGRQVTVAIPDISASLDWLKEYQQ